MSKAQDTSSANTEQGPRPRWIAAIIQKLLLPYTWLITSHRPDVVNSETRSEEWAKLRSQWRWVHAVFSYLGPPSHVLWNIKWPLLGNLFVATLAMADAIHVRDVLLDATINAAGVASWRFSSFMLSLLMAFKVNRVYERWWSGRQSSAGVGSAAYGLAQQATVWIKDHQTRTEIVRWCKVWHFSCYGLLKGETTPHPFVADLLDEDESEYYIMKEGNGIVTLRLRQLISSADLNQNQFLIMEQTLMKGLSCQNMCIRIMFQCMPYALTLMCSGFLEIWLLLMPFTVFSSNTTPNWSWKTSAFEMILYMLMCLLMMGVDEVTSQLEQPFPHMPLLKIAEVTVIAINQLQEEAATMADLGKQHMWRVQQQQEDEEAGVAPTISNGAMALKDVMAKKLDQDSSAANCQHVCAVVDSS